MVPTHCQTERDATVATSAGLLTGKRFNGMKNCNSSGEDDCLRLHGGLIEGGADAKKTRVAFAKKNGVQRLAASIGVPSPWEVREVLPCWSRAVL